MIHSPRAQPEVPKNDGLIFHVAEVSKLWPKTMVNNSHVFTLRNC